MKRIPKIASFDLQSIVAEMRMPLVELKLLAEAGRLKEVRETARQTLRLFESYLYAQQLVNSQQAPAPAQYSLPLLTADVLDDLRPLAKLHDVQLDFATPSRLGQPVSLVKTTFERATHSLVYALISCLQNKPQASLRIRVSTGFNPQLHFFSHLLQLSRQQLQFQTRPKADLGSASQVGGLPLANLLYDQLNSPLKLLANQHGGGLTVGFQATKQVLLMESSS